MFFTNTQMFRNPIQDKEHYTSLFSKRNPTLNAISDMLLSVSGILDNYFKMFEAKQRTIHLFAEYSLGL